MSQYGYQPPQQPQQGGPAYPPPPGGAAANIYRKPLKQNANIIGLAVAMITACMYLFSVPMRTILYLVLQITPRYMTDFIYETAYMLIYVLAFLAPCILAIRMLRMPVHIAFPLRSPRGDVLLAAVFIGLGARIVGNMLVEGMINFVYNTTGLMPTSPDTSIPTDIASILVYFVSVAIMPAIFEEALFRGVALQSLRRFGDAFALVTSSLLFALMHGNLVQAFYSFPLGLVMGYFVLRTGSIWVGVVIHFMNNAVVVMIEFIGLVASPEFTDAVWLMFLGISFLGAVLALVYLKWRYGAIVQIRPSNYPATEGKKYQWFFSSVFVVFALLVAVWQTAGYFE